MFSSIFYPYSTWALGDTLLHGGGHFVPASTLSLYNSANMPPSHQNLISNKNFGLYLSIDTKNSPLNSVLLPQSVAKSQTALLKKFQAQKSWNFKFWPTDALYTSKESWEHVQFRFSKKKYNFVQIFFFFHFFDFRGMVRAGRKFSMSSFSKFSKKNSRNDSTRVCLRLKGTNSESGSNFEASTWEPQEIDYASGHKVPPPRVT